MGSWRELEVQEEVWERGRVRQRFLEELELGNSELEFGIGIGNVPEELRGQGSFRNLEMELRQRGNWSPAGIVETRGWRLKPEIVFEMD